MWLLSFELRYLETFDEVLTILLLLQWLLYDPNLIIFVILYSFLISTGL